MDELGKMSPTVFDDPEGEHVKHEIGRNTEELPKENDKRLNSCNYETI